MYMYVYMICVERCVSDEFMCIFICQNSKDIGYMRKGDGNINWRCKEKEKERNVYRKRVKEGDKTSAI